ncbi:MAG: hypothetical protein RR448_10430 [Niameybacter sp.]
MSKHQTQESKIQSKIDNTRDAMNASNGFKTLTSSGTHGAGDSFRRKK